MDWKQEVLKRLDALAEKLGTTAAYLWSVLMRQAINEGVADLLWGLSFIGIMVILLVLSNKSKKYGRDEDEVDYVIGGWVMFGASFLPLMGGLDYIVNALQHFINPSYYALQGVLQTLAK